MLLAGGVLGIGLNGVPANASLPEEQPSCVVQIAPIQPGQEASEVSEPICFGSFEQAIRSIGLDPGTFQPSPANALPTPQPLPGLDADLEESPADRHCVLEIDPIRPGESASQVRPVGCFATFSEAISAATRGAVRLPPDIGPDEVTPEMLAPAQSNIVIGIDYWDSNFRGQSLVWETPHTAGCSDGSTYGSPGMPPGWNDEVSSARSYAGCNHYYHYEHTNWTGAVLDCGGSCATMGVMNDQTSSERWTP